MCHESSRTYPKLEGNVARKKKTRSYVNGCSTKTKRKPEIVQKLPRRGLISITGPFNSKNIRSSKNTVGTVLINSKMKSAPGLLCNHFRGDGIHHQQERLVTCGTHQLIQKLKVRRSRTCCCQCSRTLPTHPIAAPVRVAFSHCGDFVSGVTRTEWDTQLLRAWMFKCLKNLDPLYNGDSSANSCKDRFTSQVSSTVALQSKPRRGKTSLEEPQERASCQLWAHAVVFVAVMLN